MQEEIIYQDLVKINKECKTGEIKQNKVAYRGIFICTRDKNKQVHFMGLLSDGGVHSLDKHLYSSVRHDNGIWIKNVFIHGFGDGRDTDPRSGMGYMKNLLDHLKNRMAGLHLLLGDTMQWTATKDGKG